MLFIVALTTIGSSTKFTASVTIGIPEMAQFSYSISGKLDGSSCSHAPSNLTLLETISISLTNSQGSTTLTMNNAHTIVQDTVTCNGPTNMEVDVSLKTCSAQGSINFLVTLGGWVELLSSSSVPS